MIGADGLMASVRAALYPDEGNPVYSGQMLWRGVVDWEPVFDGRSCVMVGHNDLKAVIYPISEHSRRRGRGTLNWVAERRLPGSLPPNPADWNRRGDPADFAGAFASWRFDWLDVPQMFAATEQVYETQRLEPTAKLTLDNRETGPERVLQMVEERCPNGFENIHDHFGQAQLQEVADRYKKLAGFSRDALTRATPTRGGRAWAPRTWFALISRPTQ